jgi:hypothetical protein
MTRNQAKLVLLAMENQNRPQLPLAFGSLYYYPRVSCNWNVMVVDCKALQ